jgi:hypothetical protein
MKKIKKLMKKKKALICMKDFFELNFFFVIFERRKNKI